MMGYLAYAAGAPCPTLVLDAGKLPAEASQTLGCLTEARRYLATVGASHVLKIALVRPSEHPMFDLEYRFVQALPQGPDQFDLRGSCGHSILSATVAAERMRMLPGLTAGSRVRILVRNNGDTVVCEVDSVGPDQAEFTVHFVQPTAVPVSRLLLTGEPMTELLADGERYEVSLVSSGNAYAFIDARRLGVADRAALFAAGDALFARMAGIRMAAAERLGWPASGAFPKIAALLPDSAGRVAVRAISVPSWHPTIALTGAACLGAAMRVPHTIPWRITSEAGSPASIVDIATPGGNTAVTAATSEDAEELALAWTSVGQKRVRFHGSLSVEPLARPQREEVGQCLALPAASA
jgi:2-methylaconitate cis-trans-isomerase PrpF